MSWPTVPAEELMVKRAGSVNPADYPEETFELLSIPAFDKGVPEIVTGNAIGSSKSCVQPNDVLLSKIVPHIRRCWVVPSPQGPYRQIGSGEWIIFRSEKMHPPFLRHFLTSDLFHKQFMETTAGVGGSLVRARPAAVANIKIPLPPLPEQKRIAAILDKADAIRRKRQQAIQLADDFLRAVFLDMFGDPVKNPKGWDVKELGELCDVQGGLQVSSRRAGLPLTAPYLRVANVLRNRVDLTEIKQIELSESEYIRVKLSPSDILIVEGHGNPEEIGRCAIWKGDFDGFVHQNHLIRARIKSQDITPRFLCDYINSSGGRSQMMKSSNTTSGLNTISTGIVKSTKVIVPPRELQDTYSLIVDKVTTNPLRQSDSNSLISEVALSLSQKYFLADCI